ncbi:MAG: hypothetical protein KA118_12200, partial [Verrucomicrobia bacterium]|nr:hypothetical protein [Verrucomicrobiota bacterium]
MSSLSIKWLLVVKDFAKAHLVSKVKCLPRDLARGMYYTTIACALVRHGQSITRLGRADLVHGFRWIMHQLRVCAKINSDFAGGDWAGWQGATSEHTRAVCERGATQPARPR